MSSRSRSRKVRIVCVSDTHNHRPGEGFTLPPGDILIHAGDLTNQGSYGELKKAAEWLEQAEYAVKIVVAGNHDLSLDATYTLAHPPPSGWTVTRDSDLTRCRDLFTSIPGLTYLDHSTAEIHLRHTNGDTSTLRVCGSPYSPAHKPQNWAFQYPPSDAADIWREVPDDVDILITHTPPAGHLDTSRHWNEGGCPGLLRRLGRVRPVLHVCGHCHEGRGAEVVTWERGRGRGGSGREVGGEEGEGEGGGVADVRLWEDPGKGNKKLSRWDLSGEKDGGLRVRKGTETVIVNASVMARSHDQGGKAFNKPIVLDVDFDDVGGAEATEREVRVDVKA